MSYLLRKIVRVNIVIVAFIRFNIFYTYEQKGDRLNTLHLISVSFTMPYRFF
ncbi:hypothetical protein UABAM_04739 [Candidatus Uabimicrobium amorphum]|uniref:Uncharacterized protein n=1 Tax=Uabimicrobium amorphum TaxID=2596890 RepID=A0A5S9IQQ2_UABAM|nr:hypothetical protein UABAM_04739 [Candidatus Uabimicrobium amorphum]